MKEEKALAASLLLILIFGFLELATGFYTGSLALLSDAGHMLTDSTAILIALVGVYLSTKRGNYRMTYGLKRAEVLAAFINGLLLVFLVGYILSSAIKRFFNPVEILTKPMLLVAVIGLFVNLLVMFLLHRSEHESLGLKAALLHVVLDTIGSISTIVAGLIILFTGYYHVDPLVSIGLTLLILPQVYNLLKLSIEIFMEFAPSSIPLKEFQSSVERLPYVREVHDLHLWCLTSKECLLTMHVVIQDQSLHDRALIDISRIANSYGIEHITIQLENENTRCLLREKECLSGNRTVT